MIGVRAARVAVGALELFAPGLVATSVVRRKPDETDLVVFQVLGARHLVQGLFPRWLPAGRFATGPSLDVLHALSMVGVAAASERYRRLALVNMTDAFVFAALSARRRPS